MQTTKQIDIACAQPGSSELRARLRDAGNQTHLCAGIYRNYDEKKSRKVTFVVL
uniref:Uncharacterized protein n=1 Tax=Arundo donax TaxID=35708 RepID=A0A0A8XQ59_ARUDO